MVSSEVAAKLKLWTPQNRAEWPKWFVWTGGWYECNGEQKYYTNWPGLDGVVFDVGSYEGAWAAAMISRYGYTVHGFEPASRAYAIAKQKNPNTHNYGLGATTRDGILYDVDRDGASFIPNKYRSEPAKIVDFNEACKQIGVDRIALMSLNIEGGEFELLPHILKSAVAVERFMIQWHSVVPDYAEKQYTIQSALAETHKMDWNLGAWEAWSQKIERAADGPAQLGGR
jgi:FkbM family methyltransferase